MKYAIIAAFAATAVHAQCADPALTAVKVYTKAGCAEADIKKDNAAAEKTMLDGQNTAIKAMAKCTATSADDKAGWGDKVKAIKGNDCADGGFDLLAYEDAECKTATD